MAKHGAGHERRVLRAATRYLSFAAIAVSSLLGMSDSALGASRQRVTPIQLGLGATSWQATGLGAIRGVTIGPIENALHPDRGYGSQHYVRALREARRLGATWISLTPFGRVWDLSSSTISLTFEQPFESNRSAVKRAIDQAHAEGLRVLLVPHLWVETGAWRGELDPRSGPDVRVEIKPDGGKVIGGESAWSEFNASYRAFVREWATVARDNHVDMLAVGVELRSWLTTTYAPSFSEVIADIRKIYPGPLTYAANWDDVEQTVIWSELDVVGLNAFFPLAEKDGAQLDELCQGGKRVAARVAELSRRWNKPVVFTEFGYTTRRDPAIKPWEWPDSMRGVVVDQLAQADAYRALLSAFVEQDWFVGMFMWRLYADPDDLSQEAEWGFSPRGKLAELVLRDAFTAHWAADGPREIGTSLIRERAESVGIY
jgi:hypothetical protein